MLCCVYMCCMDADAVSHQCRLQSCIAEVLHKSPCCDKSCLGFLKVDTFCECIISAVPHFTSRMIPVSEEGNKACESTVNTLVDILKSYPFADLQGGPLPVFVLTSSSRHLASQ